MGHGIYDANGEYGSLGYGHAAEVLTLFRGILNREPDPVNFNAYTSLLEGGTPLSGVVDDLFQSPEFSDPATGLINAICGGSPSYGFGTQPPLTTVPVGDQGFVPSSEADLQNQLNDPQVSEVVLAQRVVVDLTRPLDIPAGKTLTTWGVTDTSHYANMARLVRDPGTGSHNILRGWAAVHVGANASLQGVWVDGARNLMSFHDENYNVLVKGGWQTRVTDNVLSNTDGGTSLTVMDASSDRPCGVTVARNLVTEYAVPFLRPPGLDEDGMGSFCDHSQILSNQIVDPTDVGLILFYAYPDEGRDQASQVVGNTIVSAGNSMVAAMALDPGVRGEPARPLFRGAAFIDNTFWTGPNTVITIGMSVGTRLFFNPDTYNGDNDGAGATVLDNGTGSIEEPTRVNDGLVVSGMLQANVRGNVMNLALIRFVPCVPAAIAVDPAHSSGDIQPWDYAGDYTGCLVPQASLRHGPLG
jgi:hypothetical protein